MLFQKKYDRAKQWQLEQKKKFSDYNVDYSQEDRPSIADEMEKGDMFALIFSAMITVLPVAILVLLIMVLAGYLFLRIF